MRRSLLRRDELMRRRSLADRLDARRPLRLRLAVVGRGRARRLVEFLAALAEARRRLLRLAATGVVVAVVSPPSEAWRRGRSRIEKETEIMSTEPSSFDPR